VKSPCIYVFIVSFAAIACAAAQPSATPLHDAIAQGHLRQIQTLVRDANQVNSRDENGRTPLMVAARTGDLSIIQLLLDHQADISLKDNQNNTVLHMAAQTGQSDAFKLLMDRGADVNIANSDNKTAIDIAREKGYMFIVYTYGQQREEIREETRQDMGQEVMAMRPGSTQNQDGLSLLLSDPNAIAARIQAQPGLAAKLKAVEDDSRKDEERWVHRRRRIMTSFTAALRNQIDGELSFISSVAESEKAEKVKEETDSLRQSWKRGFSLLGRQIRENRNSMANQETAVRGYRRRSRRSQQAYGDAYTNGRGRSTRARGNDEPTTEEVDPHQDLIDSWASTEDDGIDSVYEEFQNRVNDELWGLRETADTDKNTRTLAAIDGILLARKRRYEQSLPIYLATKEEYLSNTSTAEGLDSERTSRRSRQQSNTNSNQTRRRRR